ncbi:hypothetical protein AB0G73_28980 [Streptomyces sp. NPDC020719]|uniref:hypothetical protein n=1 Tax=unclassified Streptomyces TaxID=2593676 RepID=UPI0033E6B22F
MSPKVTHRTTTGLLLLTALFAAAGCGSSTSSADSGAPPSRTTPPPALSPSAPAPASSHAKPPSQDGQLLKLVVSGGFVGRHDELVVKADGGYTSTKRDGKTVTGRLTPAELAGLRRTLAAADFPHLPPRPTGRPVADGLMYQFTYEGHVVLADEIHQPQALRDVRAHLPVGYR